MGMVDFSSLIDLQIELFILMMIGYILRKVNIIPASARKSLTDLVIYVVLPANIINSFLIEMNWDIIQSGIIVLIISIIIQIFCQLLGKHLYPMANKKQIPVLSYGTICSNAGFMGNPLIESIYGSTGLLFASIYCIPQRIVMWSAGVSCFTDSKGKDVIKKVITHPCIIAVIIGMILMLTQIQLPLFLTKTIKVTSNCTTALSMIVIGGILAEINLKSVLNKLSLYYSFLRLIIIPAVVLSLCFLFKLPALAVAVCTVLSGMPAGTTTAILAEKYESDAKLAVQIVFLSTALSLITIPILCMIIEFIY